MNTSIEIIKDGKRLGGGLLITRRLALTAAHCLAPIAASRGTQVRVELSRGQILRAQVRDVCIGSDLAVIDLLDPLPAELSLPTADRCSREDPWIAPYRPAGRTDPYLAGTVIDPSITYQCEGGDAIEASQLHSRVSIGDFSGYSGGPIERPESGAHRHALVGILLEQYPDRQNPDRASDTLFSATIKHALSLFDCFDVSNLIDLLASSSREKSRNSSHAKLDAVPLGAAQAPPEEDRIRAGQTILEALYSWAKLGLLLPEEVSVLRLEVARGVTAATLMAAGSHEQ